MPVENVLRNVEWRLSQAAIVPGVGAIKVALGVVQAIAGFAVGVISAPFAICYKPARSLCVRAFCHFGHGLGNIVAGTIESIPGVGILALVIRYNKCKSAFNRVITFRETMTSFKQEVPEYLLFMAYSKIEPRSNNTRSNISPLSEKRVLYFYWNHHTTQK